MESQQQTLSVLLADSLSTLISIQNKRKASVFKFIANVNQPGYEKVICNRYTPHKAEH